MRTFLIAAMALILCVAGCDDDMAVLNPLLPSKPLVAPEHVRVQHVLIGFNGSVPGRDVTRTRNEAESLAQDLLNSAWEGADFEELVRSYSDASFPGIYAMANDGVPNGAGEFRRSSFVSGFADVSFCLSVRNIGMAAYDPVTSPYGWHLIKRLE